MITTVLRALGALCTFALLLAGAIVTGIAVHHGAWLLVGCLLVLDASAIAALINASRRSTLERQLEDRVAEIWDGLPLATSTGPRALLRAFGLGLTCLVIGMPVFWIDIGSLLGIFCALFLVGSVFLVASYLVMYLFAPRPGLTISASGVMEPRFGLVPWKFVWHLSKFEMTVRVGDDIRRGAAWVDLHLTHEGVQELRRRDSGRRWPPVAQLESDRIRYEVTYFDAHPYAIYAAVSGWYGKHTGQADGRSELREASKSTARRLSRVNAAFNRSLRVFLAAALLIPIALFADVVIDKLL